jgi:hypothetical protein
VDGRRGPRRELNADERAILAELADGAWRTSADFAHRPQGWVVRDALVMLVRRGLVESEPLDVARWRAGPRNRYRITDQGRAELAPPDRAEG